MLQAKTAEPRFDIKFELHGTNILMRDGELFMDHPIPKPISFKAATAKHTGEKVHLHRLSHELDTPLPDFLAPLVELARKLEFNVTFNYSAGARRPRARKAASGSEPVPFKFPTSVDPTVIRLLEHEGSL